MPAPTQPVTINIADFGGPSVAGITVTARLDQVDYTADGTFVGTEPVTGVTDVNGQLVLHLFPNAVPPTGLGTVGSVVRVSAPIPNSQPLDVLAAVPNAPCNLVSILVVEAPTGLSQIQQAVRAAIDNRLYPNTYAVAPTTRPDGSARQPGDRYLDPSYVEYRWNGATWVNIEANAAASASLAQDWATKTTSEVVVGQGYGSKKYAVDAAADRAAAELARDMAWVIANLYPDTATALADAALVVGKYFAVISSTSGVVADLYRKTAGPVATPTGLSVPSTALIGFIKNYAYTEDPNALLAVLAQDDEGRVAMGLKSDGEVVAGYLRPRFLSGLRTQLVIEGAGLKMGGAYTSEVNLIINAGQSNAEGTGGNALTTAQEYDNVGFPAKVLNPVAFVALTVANTGVTSSESPMYGTLGFIKELILKERGLSYTVNNYQLAATNTGYGGLAIAALNKGTTPYNLGINHVTYGYSLSQTAGKTFKAQAVTWSQGEGETGAMTRANYDTLLKQLATDYSTDIKAITGQTDDVIFITWQVNSVNVLTVGLAQMDAHEESSLVYCAGPSYFLGFDDNVHLNYYGYKWLGAYYALVYERVKVDGLQWEPLKPIAATRQGALANVRFNKSGLVLDTSVVPQQTNYGFELVDSGGSPLTISSVSLIGGDRVKVVAAASVPAGAKLRYACNAATGMSPYAGGAGNLRDSQGDEIFYDAIAKRMDNWCVAFELAL